MEKITIECPEILPLPDPLEITLPGGITMAHINLVEIIQPALAPLVPLFNIVDTVVSIFNCLKAVPEVITNPGAIIECLGDLGKAIGKLLHLIPQLSVPVMIIGLIDMLIATLKQARNQFAHLNKQIEQITEVVDKAKELNDPTLMAIAQCAEANVAQESANVGKQLASLGRLLGIINLFMGLIGGPEIPDFGDMAGKPLDEVIEVIDALINALKGVRDTIPLP
jgi:hypothetical protein